MRASNLRPQTSDLEPFAFNLAPSAFNFPPMPYAFKLPGIPASQLPSLSAFILYPLSFILNFRHFQVVCTTRRVPECFGSDPVGCRSVRIRGASLCARRSCRGSGSGSRFRSRTDTEICSESFRRFPFADLIFLAHRSGHRKEKLFR